MRALCTITPRVEKLTREVVNKHNHSPSTHSPHLTELGLNVEEFSLLPRSIEFDAVGMSQQTFMLLHLGKLLTSVPLTSEPLSRLFDGVESTIFAATSFEDLPEGPLPHLLQHLEALLEVRSV